MRTLPAALAIAFLLSACSYSQGFHRDEVREAAAPLPVVDDRAIQAVLGKRPQLPKPFRLGVYFQPLRQLSGDFHGLHSTRFTAQEKIGILQWAQALPRTEVGSVIPISDDSPASSKSLREIRIAAARYGADAVLVLNGASESSERGNSLALSYFLLLPAFFVHGTDVETAFVARASLWDVRNEYLYANAEGEADSQRSRPALLQDSEDQLVAMRAEALGKLRTELKGQFTALLAGK